uniref:DUF4283 domain-containing protein n=1 Tax=Glycine max TaxID=3847 RepID=A0A0R0GJJ8_SOYBN
MDENRRVVGGISTSEVGQNDTQRRRTTVTDMCDAAAKHRFFTKKEMWRRGKPVGQLIQRKQVMSHSAMTAGSHVTILKKKERDVDRIEEIFTEQVSKGISGPAKGMGLSPKKQGLLSHTPNGKEGNMGLNPENSKAGTENGWQVYSRLRRGQKKSHLGLYDPTSEIDMQGANLQNQSTQNMAQQGIIQNADQVHNNDTSDHNGDIVANSESESQHNQEATYIWSKAKQLGVSGVEEQKIIIEKINQMEARDKTEAERRGDNIRKTKKEVIDNALCQALWGDAEVSWEMQPTTNTTGGILCMWDPDERFGSCQRLSTDSSMNEFNEWIDDMEILEVPCVGRKFTWYRSNGASRADWTGFWVLDCWLSDNSFKELVHQCWTSHQQPGWGGYVLKEKFKRLK